MIPQAQIFIPTFEGDLKWLDVCLRSIDKYWTSPFAPIIAADNGCRGKIRDSGRDIRYVFRWSDGRRDQVYLKMMADTMVDTEAETILFMDSDCLFTKPSCTDDFCRHGLPMIKMMSYQKLYAMYPEHASILQAYKRSIWECLNVGTAYEYMRVQPFLFFKDTVTDVRIEIELRSCKTLQEVMVRYPSNTFSEFNFFGAYAHDQEDDRYCFLTPENWGESRVRQFHSWTSSPDSEKEEIDRILG